MKRWITGMLAAVLLLSMMMGLTACGKGGGTGEMTEDGLLIVDADATVELGTPTAAVDPATVYANTAYDYRMFYGDYRLLGGEEGEAAYASSMPQVTYKGGDGADSTISALPFRIVAGRHSLNHIVNYIPGKQFMDVYVYNASGYMDILMCAYTVNGNQLTLNPIDTYEYDDEIKHIRYSMSDIFLEYTFRFCGTTLTLSDGTNSVELKTGLAVTTDDVYFHTGHYVSADSPSVDGIDYIYLHWNTENREGRFSVTVADEGQAAYGVAKLEDNGRLTFTIPTEAGAKTYSFVYWYCDDDGIILSDGQTVYYYQDDYSDRFGNQIGSNISAEDYQKLGNMTDDDLQKIVETKANLLADLSAAFNDAGLAVTINEATGEIAMDAAVLFAVGDATVSEAGKDLLKQFMSVYCSVVFDDKYSDFVSDIMVEGHTDSDGDYDANLTLSQNRADSVKAFCLSAECGVDAYTAKLTDMLNAVGYSCDQPILDGNGNEDKAASRRVCFRFLINLEG